MEEKCMVNDILESIKLELNSYQNAICNTQNLRMRQTLQQIRDNSETNEYEILKIAQIKGYYSEDEKISLKEINETRNELEN